MRKESRHFRWIWQDKQGGAPFIVYVTFGMATCGPSPDEPTKPAFYVAVGAATAAAWRLSGAATAGALNAGIVP